MVRNDDYDRYILSLYAPSSSQRHIWAILAFNQEVAKIRETVSEPMLGEIRLQWWHDILDEIEANTVRDHPVVQELAVAIKIKPVINLLRQTLQARRQDILGEGTVTQRAVLAYANDAGGTLQQALTYYYIQKDTPSPECLQAAAKLGAAWTVLGLIRTIPFYWQHNDSHLLPQEASLAITLQNTEDAWNLLKPIISEMSLTVLECKNSALKYKQNLTTAEKPTLLLGSLISYYQNLLERADGNPFKMPAHDKSNFKKLLHVFWAQLAGKY
ncbi:squalene/phytoene synthase family protein [Kordiimonas pumila]|uniref:Squalene/phytoene synthase family protein n=1 Tax=Kordiimonas pumila TaxID=2161677 RepID=A0ABV7D278_9PROT|nr:squalene/phytoene synthase family protein [Kordiimonas pumila]